MAADSLADEDRDMYPNLKLEIFKRGIHQNHLARMLGIGEAILSKIIHGSREPSELLKRKIADRLQVDEAWLFEKYLPGSASDEPTIAEPLFEEKNGVS
jgi:transcriptional regulator with XRE-family HTH domain